MQTRTNWLQYLRTYLGLRDLDIRLEEQGTDLVIEVQNNDAPAVQAALESLLQIDSDPNKNLPYQISQSQPTVSTVPVELTRVASPADDVNVAKNILYNLFGNDVFEEVGLDFNLIFNKEAEVKNGLIFSKSVKRDGAVAYWESVQTNILSPVLGQISPQKLRCAFVSKEVCQLVDTSQADATELTTANEIMARCFGVISYSNPPQAKMFFNYGLLYRLLFPPKIAQTPDGKDKTRFIIPKPHLNDYLTPANKLGFRFVIADGDDNSKILKGFPILADESRQGVDAHTHTLLIDRSGSMGTVFASLKQKLLQFIEGLRKVDDQAMLRLVFFHSSADPVQEFHINDKEKIEIFVNEKTTGANTALYPTVLAAIDYIISEYRGGNKVFATHLVTDGQDNSGGMPSFEFFEMLEKKFAEMKLAGIPIPPFYTIGYGDEADHELLGKLARLTGTPYVQLQTMADFSEIYSRINKITAKRQMLKLSLQYQSHQQEKNLRSSTYTIPFYHTGDPQIPGIEISMPLLGTSSQRFVAKLGDNEMVVTVDPTKVPKEDAIDLAHDALIKANRIILNENLLIDARVDALKQLHLKTMSLPVEPSHSMQKQFVDEVGNRITKLHNDLKNAIGNKANYDSLMSQAREAQGFMNEQHSEIMNVEIGPSGNIVEPGQSWYSTLFNAIPNFLLPAVGASSSHCSAPLARIENNQHKDSSWSAVRLMSHYFDKLIDMTLAATKDHDTACPAYFLPGNQYLWQQALFNPQEGLQNASHVNSSAITPITTPFIPRLQ